MMRENERKAPLTIEPWPDFFVIPCLLRRSHFLNHFPLWDIDFYALYFLLNLFTPDPEVCSQCSGLHRVSIIGSHPKITATHVAKAFLLNMNITIGSALCVFCSMS